MNGEASSLTRILFVDDSKVMLKTASKLLSAEFDVITAIDGNDAWEKLARDHEVQVLFTDINMPGMDGYELLNKVRTSDDHGLRDMPVILVTGAEDDESARQQAVERGATDFLSKRFLGTELIPRARAHAKYQRISVQLQAQITLDPLTGLDNEAGFLHRLEQDIAYARRHGQELALMRVEIDGLVNMFTDRGNAVVEQMVVQVANLIRRRIREEDTAAHIGLGGFAISLPGGHLEGIEAMATFLHDKAASGLEVDGRRFPISLTTAVISTGAEVWTSAKDALDRCKTMPDRTRRKTPAVPVPAPVEQRKPAIAEATPSPAAARTPEPATAQKSQPAQPVRHEPARVPSAWETTQVPAKTPNALQRLMASLRSFGAKQLALLGRVLKKLAGK